MKKLLLLIVSLFLLNGCYSSVGIGGGIPLGNSSTIGSSVNLGSDGQLHGSVGVGGWSRI
jgi:UDP-3-O-[3-hydroxymyristoyl] glucosamine N-acyltransferase